MIEVRLAFCHAERLGAADRRHAIHPGAAVNDADAECTALTRHLLDFEDFARHRADRRAAFGQTRAGMARPAGSLQVEARDGVAAGHDTAVPTAWFGNEQVRALGSLRVD